MFDEIEKALLAIQGYSVSGSNIIDSSGNLVPTTTINGKEYSSFDTEESFAANKAKQTALTNSGFAYKSGSPMTRTSQEDVHLHKQKLKDPKNINFDMEDPLVKEAVRELYVDSEVDDYSATQLKERRSQQRASEDLAAEYYIAEDKKAKEEPLVNPEIEEFYKEQAALPEGSKEAVVSKPLDKLDRMVEIATRMREMEDNPTFNRLEEKKDIKDADRILREQTSVGGERGWSVIGTGINIFQRARQLGSKLSEYTSSAYNATIGEKSEDEIEYEKLEAEIIELQNPVVDFTRGKITDTKELIKKAYVENFIKRGGDKMSALNNQYINPGLIAAAAGYLKTGQNDYRTMLYNYQKGDVKPAEFYDYLMKTFPKIDDDSSKSPASILSDNYNKAIENLNEEEARLASWQSQDKDYNPFGTTSRVKDYLTVGMLPMGEELMTKLPILNKLKENDLLPEADRKKPEQILSESEMILAETWLTKGKIDNLGLKQTDLYEMTHSTAESAKFMVGMPLGSPLASVARKGTEVVLKKALGNYVQRAVTTNLLGRTVQSGAAGFLDVAAITTGEFAGTLLHPQSYSNALDLYNGEIDTRVDEKTGEVDILVGERLYQTVLKENQIKIDELDKSLDYLESIEKPSKEEQKQIGEIREAIKSISNLSKMFKPQSAVKSFASAGLDVVKERIFEAYTKDMLKAGSRALTGGSYTPNLVGRTIENIAESKTVGRIKNSTVAKAVNLISDNKLRRGINKATGVNMVGGIGEEMVEEAMIQLAPSLGKEGFAWDEYQEQLSELTNPDFYKMVAGQTMIMSGGMSTLSVGSHAKNFYAEKKQEKRYAELAEIGKRTDNEEKEYQDLYKSIGSSKNLMRTLKDTDATDEQLGYALMNSGFGNFSIQEYNNRITELRNSGEPENINEAQKLEEDKFFNMAMAAHRAGKGGEFSKALRKSHFNKNLKPETVASMEKVRKDLAFLEKNYGEIEGMHSSQSIITAVSRKRYNEKAEKEHTAEISKLENNIEITEGFDDTVKKAFEVENASDVDLKNESNREKLFDYINANNVSPEISRYASLKESLIGIKALKDKNNSLLKEMTSRKYQLQKGIEQEFVLAVDNKVQSNIGKNATEKQIFDVIDEVIKNKRFKKQISKKKVESLKAEVAQGLKVEQMQTAISGIQKAQQQAEDEKGVEPKLGEKTGSPLYFDFLEEDNEEGSAEFFANAEPGEDMLDFEDTVPANPRIVGAIREFIKEEGDTSFESVIMNLVREAKLRGSENPFADIKNMFPEIAKAYEEITEEESGWKAMFKDIYKITARGTLLDTILAEEKSETAKEKLDPSVTVVATKPEIEKFEEASTQEVVAKENTAVLSIDPKTGRPLKSLVVSEVTTNTSEHKAVTGTIRSAAPIITEVGNGESTVTIENAEDVPTLNTEDKNINNKKFVTPGTLVDDKEIGITAIKASDWTDFQVRDSSGELISFLNWVNANQGEMSIEEFATTDAFIKKVPIVYTIDGVKSAYLHETDYYTSVTVGVPGQKQSEPRNINNPSPAHQELIDKNKAENLQLRKDILSGEVSKMKVESHLGMAIIKAKTQDINGDPIPAKPLSEMTDSSDPVIFVTKGGTIKFIDGNTVKHSQIVNLKAVISKEGGKYTNGLQTMYLAKVGVNKKGETLYQAFSTLRKKADGITNGIHESDNETIKWLSVVHKVLFAGNKGETSSEGYEKTDHKNHMTYEQAKAINSQLKKIDRNYNLGSKDAFGELSKAIGISMKTDKDGNTTGKNMEEFATGRAAENGGDFQQNTSYKFKGKIPEVSFKEGEFLVSVAKNPTTGQELGSYSDYLKTRLSTNVMSYNVGNEVNPVMTPAVRKSVIFTPVYRKGTPAQEETKKIETKIEENKEVETKVEVVENNVQEIKAETKEIEKEVEVVLSAEQEAIIKAAMESAAVLGIDLGEEIEEGEDTIPDLDSVVELEQSSNQTPGYSIDEDFVILGKLVSLFSDKNKGKETVKSEFLTFMEAKRKHSSETLANLESIAATVPSKKIDTLVSSYKRNLAQIEEVIEDTDLFIVKAVKEAELNHFGAKDPELLNEAEIDNELGTEESNYSKASNEATATDKVGVRIKRLFAQIPNGKTGYLGIERYDSFDNMYNTIIALMSTDVLKQPDFQGMMDKLSQFQSSYPWIKPLIEELQGSPVDVQNLFTTNAFRQAVNAKIVLFSNNKEGGMSSSLFSSNANSTERLVKDFWKESLKRTTLTVENKLNKEALVRIKAEMNGISKMEANSKIKHKAARKWLENFGIVLHDNTWKAIKNGKLYSKEGGIFTLTNFEDLFDVGENRGGKLFQNLAVFASQSIDKIKEGNEMNVEETPENHPFFDMGDILKQLSTLESQHNPVYISSTRRVAGKTVAETEMMTYAYSQITNLKASGLGDKKIIEALQELDFSKDSFILDLLKNDEGFAESFDHGFFDIMSLKKKGEKDPMYSGISELSNLDYMFAVRSAFQDVTQGKVSSRHMGFSLRIGTMATPTNSDKGKMLLMKTAVFNLIKDSGIAFNFDADGKVSFTEDLRDLLFQQLVLPEARRALNYDGKTNIKNYSKGASRFNFMPVINTLTNAAGETVSHYLEPKNSISVELFEEKFGAVIGQVIEESILQEVNANLKQTEVFINEVTKKDSFNNDKYLKQQIGESKDAAQSAMLAELDFVINSKISTMNTFQIMAGDPALYAKSREKISHLSGQELIEANNRISKELGINLGKRMALMIAPGAILADSHNNEYAQLFIEDSEDITTSINYLIKIHYGKKALDIMFEGKSVANLIAEFQTLSTVTKADKTRAKDIRNFLKREFPKLKDYLAIETADGQEYTTLNEHLYILEKQGKISEELSEQIKSTIAAGGTLNKEVLNVVFQPLKPVYTGGIIQDGVNRMMYIKSSSFPLLPQLTQGTKLDKLRTKMEMLEETSGKTVRAAYGTAVKVGALTNSVNMDDLDNTDFEGVDSENRKEFYMTLPRINFKIQQENPFKSNKVQADKVSMGTQITKLLFGDGVIDVVGFEFKGVTMDGAQLKEEFTKAYTDMVNIHRSGLLRELGLDENLRTKDAEHTNRQMQKLLVKEAESRGFSNNDIKSLGLVKGTNTFKVPLFLSANSNKYEAMLNAIVSNRMFKQKLPGAGLIVGSENGLNWGANLDAVKDKSRIVWVDGPKDINGINETKSTKEALTSEQKELISQSVGTTEVPDCI